MGLPQEGLLTAWYDWRRAPAAEFAVVGDPVAHSWSSAIHRAAFREMGWTYRYTAVRVPVEEFDMALEWLIRLGYRGLNVTVPLKEAAFRWADSVDVQSAEYGALNTLSLRDGRGTNTDAPGFLDSIQGRPVEGRRVLILGAGGTARTLARCLGRAGAEVLLWNRTRSRAARLAEELGETLTILDSARASGCSVVVNCTSAGLQEDSVEIDWDGVSSEALAIDVVYSRDPTPFLRDASAHGVSIADGRGLLVAQAARSFEWWHAVAAPRSAMEAVVTTPRSVLVPGT